MRQPSRLRNHYRKTLSPTQRRNRWLLWATAVLLAVGGNRWVSSCRPVEQAAPPGGPIQLASRTP